ncbi:exo-alpha-sialidase [Aeoliella sp.]|uniref:exo-alpha-sialidase n=1 Tax=Aeoliella sp. TaxID=2795800 RepID=UPI003CCBD711
MRLTTSTHFVVAITALAVVFVFASLSIAKDTLTNEAKDASSLQVTSRPLVERIRVACIGDSITYGSGIENRHRDSYPSQLQRILGSGYEVRNFGRPGADVLSINNGPYSRAAEHLAALEFEPSIVVCNLGINDHALIAQNQNAFVRDYTSLLGQYAALSSKPQLLIWTKLAPVMRGQKNYRQCLQLQNTYAALLEQVAKECEARGIDMHAPLAGHPEWFPDHLHPNAQGAEVVSQTVAVAVAQLSADSSVETTTSSQRCDNGFEGAPVGEWQQMTTPLGDWQAAPEHAEINSQHVRTGNRSLRIMGGKNRHLELSASSDGQSRKVLSFWAERWTARQPFRFRIEQQVGDNWVEVYDGDKEIRVGGFNTHISVPLKKVEQIKLRMTLTTPESTGLLVDDVELADGTPMIATTAVVDQPTLPALVGTEWSAVTRVRVDVDGNLGPAPSLTALELTTEGTTDLKEISKVQAYYTGSQPLVTARGNPNAFVGATPFGKEYPSNNTISIPGNQTLSPGANYFWIACQLKSDANIDHFVNAVPTKAQLAGGQALTLSIAEELAGQRLGVAVRRRGDDGVHTFRIPGLATTNDGTLIAVYDIRRRGGGDLPGDIDVGMSRSTDRGQTWEPMQVIMDMGEDPRWRFDGIGDPAVLVDRETNTIWVAAVWSHGNRGWHGSQPGMDPEDTGQLMLVRSDDDGETWSEPINITTQVKRPEWCFLLQGPGKGITMSDGTLVFAAQYQDTSANKRLPRSTIIYSRDHGETWKIGTGAFDDTTEAQVVELEPGVLMLNCRYNRDSKRVVVTSSDMGQTWQEHPSSRTALNEPRACMASLIQGPTTRGASWLLFSNPNNLHSRRQMTIKASSDQGHTWREDNQLLLDEAPSAGYSCMSMTDIDAIGILYEGSQGHMTFQRIPMDGVVGK